MKNWFNLILLAITINLFGCGSDTEAPEVSIHPELVPFVQQFQREADLRNLQVDLTKMSIAFSGFLLPSCGTNLVFGSHTLISAHEDCWGSLNNFQKEKLIFHELGHTILNRVDDENKLQSGSFKSIMNSSTQSLYNGFTLEKRTYYIDELFNANTAVPDWAGEKLNTIDLNLGFNSTVDQHIGSWAYFNILDDFNGNGRSGERTNEVGSSHSLKMVGENLNQDSDGFSLWRLPIGTRIGDREIEVGSRLTLKVKVRLEDVQGQGVAIAFRGESRFVEDLPFFLTTENSNSPLVGTQDFIEQTLVLDYYPNGVDGMSILLLMLSKTSGTAYFDDITLQESF